jgi:hypothetical protein
VYLAYETYSTRGMKIHPKASYVLEYWFREMQQAVIYDVDRGPFVLATAGINKMTKSKSFLANRAENRGARSLLTVGWVCARRRELLPHLVAEWHTV